MNGSPHRLDLSAERARRAVAAGCILTIDSDAHHTRELDYVRWGVVAGAAGWVEPRRRAEHPVARGPARLGRGQARAPGRLSAVARRRSAACPPAALPSAP